ncbi:MAG: hypothetical protein KC656_01665 [Myxococcales bacterium]|nr:hypothetical protein [Myxococcales bacterium]
MRTFGLGVAVVGVLACAGGDGVTEGPAAAPVPEAPRTALPDEQVPVAFVVRSGEHELYWTPEHPTADVVVFTMPGGWSSVPDGAVFEGVGAAGTVSLSYTGESGGKYGCDGGSDVTWATFSADGPLPEGVLALYPKGATGGRKSVPIALDGTPTVTSRAWKVGEGRMAITRTDDLKADVALELPGLASYRAPYEAYRMEGAEEGAIDLSEGVDIGMPEPVLLVRGGPGARLISRVPSYEGVHFEVVDIGATAAQVVGRESLYWCAF